MKTTWAVVALVLTAACGSANNPTSKFHDLLTQKNIAPHDMAEAETLAKSLCAKLDQGTDLATSWPCTATSATTSMPNERS